MRCPRIRLLSLALLASSLAFGQDPPPDGPVLGLLDLLFVANPGPLGDAQISGLPAGSKPEVLTWQRAYALALIHARAEKPPRYEAFDADQIDARTRELDVADFARFRADLVTNRGFRDPSADILDLQARHFRIENGGWKVAHLEHFAGMLAELVRGESSGVNQLDLDAMDASLADEKRGFHREIAEYRDRLDAARVALGLAPHAPVAIDAGPLAPFRQVFDQSNRWFLSPRRTLEELDRHAARLPTLGDVVIDGRPVLVALEKAPDRLEEVLGLATRAALRGRAPDEAGDAAELRVRKRIRHLAEVRTEYEITRRTSVIAARQMNQVYEDLITPPMPMRPGGPERMGSMLMNLIAHTHRIAEIRSRLVALWCAFHAERLALYREIGSIPFEDWESFYGQFAARLNEVEGARPEAPAPPPVPPPPPPPAKPQDE